MFIRITFHSSHAFYVTSAGFFILNLVVYILTCKFDRVKRKDSAYESTTQYVWFMSVYVSHQLHVTAYDT